MQEHRRLLDIEDLKLYQKSGMDWTRRHWRHTDSSGRRECEKLPIPSKNIRLTSNGYYEHLKELRANNKNADGSNLRHYCYTQCDKHSSNSSQLRKCDKHCGTCFPNHRILPASRLRKTWPDAHVKSDLDLAMGRVMSAYDLHNLPDCRKAIILLNPQAGGQGCQAKWNRLHKDVRDHLQNGGKSSFNYREKFLRTRGYRLPKVNGRTLTADTWMDSNGNVKQGTWRW